MLKTKDERYEAFMEYLDEMVEAWLDNIIDDIDNECDNTQDGFFMDRKEKIAFVDEIWQRCFVGKKK